MPTEYNHDHLNEITLFGETNYRNERRRFGIKTDDRRRHMYVIGKTGMGKTTLMENLIVQDIQNGHGCCYIDPHGDTAETLLDFIPSNRINDVVYFNPSDIEYPVGFNILETESDEQKPLIASGLMGVFKKIWPDVWSARMEYILMNCVLALLDYPGATLLGINRILVDKEYRTRVVQKIRDPIVKTFWIAEFAGWSEKYATEAIAPVQNKVGQFLSSSVIRNMVAQVKSSVNLRRVMDDGKILVVNLSKGRIGEDNMLLLGGMLITKLQLAAQERQNVAEDERRDFYLYVDEFQNFANESFASILSEARKFRLNLIVAHQYIEQLDEQVAAAIFGNAGTIITMRVGATDAEKLEPEFAPTFVLEDLLNISKYNMYLKLMVDGVATPPFSALSLPPIAKHMDSRDKVIAISRERYAEPRALIEEKVLRWSGMETAPAGSHASLSTATAEASPMSVNLPEVKVPEISLNETAKELTNIIQYPAIKPAKELKNGALEEAQDEGEFLRILPERLEAIQKSVSSKKSNKPKFPHTCSRCGKVWDLPVQLDPSRPMYCPECRPIVLEERKNRSNDLRKFKKSPPPPEISDRVKVQSPVRAKGNMPEQKENNRPRLIQSNLPPGKISIVKASESRDDDEDLLTAILRAKEKPVELRKKTLEKRAGDGKRADGPKPVEEKVKLDQATETEAPKRKRRRKRKPTTGASAQEKTGNAKANSPAPQNDSVKKLAPGERITFDE